MSRVGKKPIVIPPKTEVHVEHQAVTVKGPLGELKRSFLPDVLVTIVDGKVIVTPTKETLFTKALWGTTVSHIQNMVEGVNKLYQKRLLIEGIGYKAEVSGSTLVLHIGFSHSKKISIPPGVKVVMEKNIINITGIDKEAVSQLAATIRLHKKPEPYKGKGIRYENEVVRRKQGKRAV